jgi:hypothetical protein
MFKTASTLMPRVASFLFFSRFFPALRQREDDGSSERDYRHGLSLIFFSSFIFSRHLSLVDPRVNKPFDCRVLSTFLRSPSVCPLTLSTLLFNAKMFLFS